MAQVIEPVVLANSKFSIDLLKELCKDKTKQNVLFSPLSISSALGLVCLGAKGETEEQILKTLRMDHMKIMYHDLYEELYKGGWARSLHLVNRMFAENTMIFTDDFLDKCEEWCYASVRNVDFKTDPEAARKYINNWVEKKTGGDPEHGIPGYIQDMLGEKDVSKDTVLALVSAVRFTDKWATKFEVKDENRPMMYLTGTYLLGNIPHRQHEQQQHVKPLRKARILEIPYANRDLSMLILLPEKSDGLQELVDMITYENLLEWTEPDNMIPTKNVYVEIPIFELKENYDVALENALKTLGMTDVFDDAKCDLSGMTPKESKLKLKLSKVVHKSFVKVNEEGTEADGGTGGDIGPKSRSNTGSESFVADHPFLFFIRHNPTKSIIFWGRFTPPTEPQI